jgi:hypothetical protein
MKIITPTVVSISGTGEIHTNHTFWIENDDGSRFSVDIPNHPAIIEQFVWLSDNDCLRHLKSVSPVLQTNNYEIQHAIDHNTMIDEHFYLAKSYKSKTSPFDLLSPYGNRVEIPSPTWEVLWSFWSKEHAILFKIAVGGSI